MTVWIVLNVAFLLVLAFFIVNNLINMKKVPRLESFSFPGQTPRVSIIVPARNEEHNIERCLVSLLSQDYPNAEVVLVNDNSTDGTAGIASMIGMRFPSLRIITGRPLPKGWAGKNWACHQGVQASQGEILLFTDRGHPPQALGGFKGGIRAPVPSGRLPDGLCQPGNEVHRREVHHPHGFLDRILAVSLRADEQIPLPSPVHGRAGRWTTRETAERSIPAAGLRRLTILFEARTTSARQG